MSNVYYRFLFPEELEEACHILVKGLAYKNPIWTMLNPNPNYQQLFNAMLERITQSYKTVLVNGLFIDGKMVGCTNAYIMEDYLKFEGKTKSQLLSTLGKYGKQLEKSLYTMQHSSKILYLGFISILEEYTSGGHAFYLLNESLRMMGKSRAQYGYIRISNPIIGKMVVRMGGVKINEMKIKDQKSGKQYSFILYRLDLRKIPTVEEIMAQKSSL